MKKVKAADKTAPKKLNKNNKSPVAKLKSGLKAVVKAMSAKPAKKAQTKAAPSKPAAKAKPAAKVVDKKKAVVAKAPAKPVAKAAPAAKVPAKKAAPVIEVKATKGAKAAVVEKASEKAVEKAPAKGAKAVPAPVAPVAAKKKGAEKKSKALDLSSDKMCRENACENQATTKGYCRLDYIKNWKKIKRKEMILKEGKLNQYIEELVGKYPDKYIDVIRQDLSTEVNFNKVIHDLELDESIDDLDYDGDSIDSLIGSISKSEGGDGDEF